MLPVPHRGLIVSHCYVWFLNFDAGYELSDRPHPVVVISVRSKSSSRVFRVLVLAITHSPPQSANAAVEIPDEVKTAAGLDDHPQWVVVNEANAFTWPGADLRNISGRDPPSPVYGTMPIDFLTAVISAYLACGKADPTGAREVELP